MAFETTVLNQATDIVLFTGARPLLGLGASALITLFVTRDPNEWKRLLLPNLILIGWGATIFTKTAADVAIMTVITVVALLISLMATLRVNNIAGSIRTVSGFSLPAFTQNQANARAVKKQLNTIGIKQSVKEKLDNAAYKKLMAGVKPTRNIAQQFGLDMVGAPKNNTRFTETRKHMNTKSFGFGNPWAKQQKSDAERAAGLNKGQPFSFGSTQLPRGGWSDKKGPRQTPFMTNKTPSAFNFGNTILPKGGWSDKKAPRQIHIPSYNLKNIMNAKLPKSMGSLQEQLNKAAKRDKSKVRGFRKW